jgi:hypothetical protein
MAGVRRMSRATFEAEFGHGQEHEAVIARLVPKTPACLVQLERFDDGPEVALKLRPTDPPPEAA